MISSFSTFSTDPSHNKKVTQNTISANEISHSEDVKTIRHLLPNSEAEEVFQVLYDAKICNEKGEPLPHFENLAWPSIDSTIGWVEKVHQRLNAPQYIHLKVLEQTITLSFSLYELFIHLSTFAKDEKIEISKIEWVGRSILEMIPKDYLQQVCQKLFPTINATQIQKWFNSDHIKNWFEEKGSDYDFRLWTSERSRMNDEVLNFLVSKLDPIIDFDSLKKSLPERYQTLSRPETLRACLILFKGVSKPNTIFNAIAKYDITCLETAQMPIDILSIEELQAKQVFSSDSLGIDISTSHFKMLTGNFSAAKFFIDLLCQISTVYNTDCMTQVHLIRWMTYQTSFCQGEELLVQKAFVRSTLYSQERYRKDPSDSFYIFSSMEEFIKKHKKQHKAIHITMRICQLLEHTKKWTEADIMSIWQRMNEAGLLPVQKETPPLDGLLKKTILEEKIPFKEVSAWLQCLSFLLQTSSKHFLPQYIHLEDSLTLIGALPKWDAKKIELFKEIYQCFIGSSQLKFPSAPHSCLKTSLEWMESTDETIRFLGVGFHLAVLKNTATKDLLENLFKLLPQFLNFNGQTIFILKAIDEICSKLNLPAHSQAIQTLLTESQPTKQNWIACLVRTKDSQLISMGYQLLKQDLDKIDSTLMTETFEAIRPFDRSRALFLFTQLTSLDKKKRLELFFRLCINIKEEHFNEKEWRIASQIAFTIINEPLPSHITKQEAKEAFSNLLIAMFRHISEEQKDEFLIQCSRHKYILQPDLTTIWVDHLAQPHPKSVKLLQLAQAEKFLEADEVTLDQLAFDLVRGLFQNSFHAEGLEFFHSCLSRLRNIHDLKDFLIQAIKQEFKKDTLTLQSLALLDKGIEIHTHPKVALDIFCKCIVIATKMDLSSSPFVLKWLQKHQTLMLVLFQHNQRIRETDLFLRLLDRYEIPRENTVIYTLWICHEASDIIYHFSKEPQQPLNDHLLPIHAPLLKYYVEWFLSENRVSEGVKWLKKLCSFSHESSSLVIEYCSQLIKSQNHLETFQLLLLNTQFDAHCAERASTLILQMSHEEIPPLELATRIFFNQAVLEWFKAPYSQLSEKAYLLFERLMSLPDYDVALKVIQTYHPLNMKLWRALFESNLSPHQIEEAWHVFKNQKNLPDKTAEPACWLALFKSLHRIHHPDLLEFLEKEDFFESLNLDAHSFLIRIDMCRYLLLNAIHQLTLEPKSIKDNELRLKIIIKKNEVIGYFKVNQLLIDTENKNGSSKLDAALNVLNQDLELALAERLSSSSQPHDLLQSLQFLQRNEAVIFLDKFRGVFLKTLDQLLESSSLHSEIVLDADNHLDQLMKIALAQEILPLEYLVNMITKFVKKMTDNRLPVCFKILLKILDAKSAILSSADFSHLIVVSLSSHDQLSITEECLEKGMRFLSPHQKIQTISLFLKRYLNPNNALGRHHSFTHNFF